jgi:hypothetical protein
MISERAPSCPNCGYSTGGIRAAGEKLRDKLTEVRKQDYRSLWQRIGQELIHVFAAARKRKRGLIKLAVAVAVGIIAISTTIYAVTDLPVDSIQFHDRMSNLSYGEALIYPVPKGSSLSSNSSFSRFEFVHPINKKQLVMMFEEQYGDIGRKCSELRYNSPAWQKVGFVEAYKNGHGTYRSFMVFDSDSSIEMYFQPEGSDRYLWVRVFSTDKPLLMRGWSICQSKISTGIRAKTY